MRVSELPIEGLKLIEPQRHGDERGFFIESYRQQWHAELGIPAETRFVQDNHSRSARGVVRGLHFQLGAGVGKLVRCVRGSIFDVGVDLRRGSPTFGRWAGAELNDENGHGLYVPVGFAHGFCALSELADVTYKQTGYYDADLEAAIAWDDPEIAIAWPLPAGQLTVSERDAQAPQLSDVAGELPFSYRRGAAGAGTGA